MNTDEIKLRLQEAVITIRNMPDGMMLLRYKSSMPEIVRLGKEWMEYNTQAAQDNLKTSLRRRSTPKEETEAMQVVDWIHYACSKRPLEIRKVLHTIIFVHSYGAGFRLTADVVLERTGKRYSHATCKTWYDQAVDDIQDFIRKNK